MESTGPDISGYLNARALMLPGDVIVFAGTAPISHLIDIQTGSNISHVAQVRQALSHGPETEPTIIESTMGKINGVQTSDLREVLVNYGTGSRAWWLPLSNEVRAAFSLEKFYATIGQLEGATHYDLGGLFGFILRALPILGPHLCQSEHTKAMFCSALVTDLLEQSGVLRGLNYSEVDPQRLVEMKLYRESVQILGTPGKLIRFNSF